MKRINTKSEVPLPCVVCGSQPLFAPVEHYFKTDDAWITKTYETRCPTSSCNYHRHFTPKATKREAIKAWNKSNRVRAT